MQPTGIPVEFDQMIGQSLFSELGRNSVESIARGGWNVEKRRGERILGRGDRLDGLYSVFEGNLKLYMLSCNGDEQPD